MPFKIQQPLTINRFYLHVHFSYINLQNSWALKDVVEIENNMDRIEELENLNEELSSAIAELEEFNQQVRYSQFSNKQVGLNKRVGLAEFFIFQCMKNSGQDGNKWAYPFIRDFIFFFFTKQSYKHSHSGVVPLGKGDVVWLTNYWGRQFRIEFDIQVSVDSVLLYQGLGRVKTINSELNGASYQSQAAEASTEIGRASVKIW